MLNKNAKFDISEEFSRMGRGCLNRLIAKNGLVRSIKNVGGVPKTDWSVLLSNIIIIINNSSLSPYHPTGGKRTQIPVMHCETTGNEIIAARPSQC